MKLKYLLILCLLGFLNDLLFAQSRQGNNMLQGYIIDSLTRKPIDYATISLLKEEGQVPVKGVLADNKGTFSLTQIQAGSYSVSINFIGYAKKVIRHVSFSDQNTTKNLGAIVLSPSIQKLKGITVTTDRLVYESKIDRLVYNVENDATTPIGDATDLMRKVPMLSVDMNGNVAVRGNKNVKILIDGKATGAMSGSTGDLLQSIPAAQIKSVEVITSPSAKYDAEGSGGIINIITRRKTLEGVNGAIATGIGTRQLTSNVSLNAKLHKLTFNFSAGISNKWPRIADVDFYSYDAQKNTSSSTGSTRNTRLSNNSSATVSYDVDEKNSFSSTFRSTSLGYNDDLNTRSVNTSSGNSTINYGLSSKSKDRSAGFDWSGDYLHQFKKKGEELDIAAQWSQNTSRQDYRALYSDFFPDQQASNHGKNNEYTLQADYTLPINKAIKLEAGGKSIFRRIESLYDYFNIDPLGNNTYNALSSNIYDYKQDVYAGYTVLEFALSHGWTVQAGNRIEVTRISGKSENIQSGLLPFTDHYNNYIPSLILAKKITESQTVKLSYNKRIQRPSLQYLNPFKNTNDPLNQTQGTPDLSPERVQTIELGYDTYIKTVSLNASVYYKLIDNLIESFVKTVPYTTVDATGNITTRMVSLTNYGNIGTNNSFGMNLFGSVNIRKKFAVRGSFNFYTYHPEVYPDYGVFLNPGVFYQYNGLVSGSYKFNKGVSVETVYSFQSKVRTFQGTTSNLNILNVGVKKAILKQKGTIGLVAVNPFHNKWNFTDYIHTSAITQYNNFSTPFRSFNLNFVYRFGKLKMKPVSQRGVNNDDLKEGQGN